MSAGVRGAPAQTARGVGAEMTMRTELAGNCMLVDAESVHLSELHAVREGPLLRLRYLW